MKMNVFWDTAPRSVIEMYQHFRGAIIALTMEATNISETSINFYRTTPLNFPEDSHFRFLGYLTTLFQL
jgi:hypothetical protein